MKNKFFKTYPLYLSKNGIFHKAKHYQYVELTALGKKVAIAGGALLALAVVGLIIFLT